MRGLLSMAVVVWLVIGAFAAYQRGYFGGDREASCKTCGDTALTILAGPLSYVGENPKIACEVRERSE